MPTLGHKRRVYAMAHCGRALLDNRSPRQLAFLCDGQEQVNVRSVHLGSGSWHHMARTFTEPRGPEMCCRLDHYSAPSAMGKK